MNKQELRDYLKQADISALSLSKMRGDADVIAALLSSIYILMIKQAQYELEKEESDEHTD